MLHYDDVNEFVVLYLFVLHMDDVQMWKVEFDFLKVLVLIGVHFCCVLWMYQVDSLRLNVEQIP